MSTPTKKKANKPRCGLCGKTKNLIQTECCGNWICDDLHKYVPFSYSTKSCSRNHQRYTLCAFHFNEGHKGDWKTCKKCRAEFEPEMVVWYGTNEHNFEKMPDPPAYEPTLCASCGTVIQLGVHGCVRSGDQYRCMACATSERKK